MDKIYSGRVAEGGLGLTGEHALETGPLLWYTCQYLASCLDSGAHWIALLPGCWPMANDTPSPLFKPKARWQLVAVGGSSTQNLSEVLAQARHSLSCIF
jgi:hypothetical protein